MSTSSQWSLQFTLMTDKSMGIKRGLNKATFSICSSHLAVKEDELKCNIKV